MVIVEAAPALPGVTEVGENATVAPLGRPVAARVTDFVKLSFKEAIFIW